IQLTLIHTVLLLLSRPPPRPTLFPYTTLFRSIKEYVVAEASAGEVIGCGSLKVYSRELAELAALAVRADWQGRRAPRALESKPRSEEHTSELQSRFDLVCRLLLEKKKKQN